MGVMRSNFGGLLMLGVVCLFSACSHQDFGRPIHSPISDMLDSQNNAFLENQEQAQALERSKRFAKVLAESNLDAGDDKPDYHLGQDDVLKLEILSFEEPGKMSTLMRTVAADGTINLSWAGKVKIAGLNVQGAEKAIQDHLVQGYIKDPRLSLSVAEHKSAGVLITGAVSRPGVYFLKRDKRKLLEVLAQADGLNSTSGDELMLVRGKESAAALEAAGGSATNNLLIVDLTQLIDEGDLRMNVWIRRGDLITVQPRKATFISILGYVNRPGSFDISGKGSVTVLDALGMAGGLTSLARAENSWVLRQTKEGQKMVQIDITAMARGAKPATRMRTGDTLIVGSSLFAKLSEFIKVGGSVGASYSPMP